MSIPRWDDEMKFELFRLKSELKIENFRVLSRPLGLGRIQQEASSRDKPLFPNQQAAASLVRLPALQAATLLHPVPASARPNSEGISTPLSLEPLSKKHDNPEFEDSPDGQEMESDSWIRRLVMLTMVHLLDLGFVALCLCLGFLAFTLVSDPTNMSFDPQKLAQAGPVAFLQKLQVWALLLGLYAVFILYWLFFKFVSGQTLGETCVSILQPEDEALSEPVVKDSAKT